MLHKASQAPLVAPLLLLLLPVSAAAAGAAAPSDVRWAADDGGDEVTLLQKPVVLAPAVKAAPGVAPAAASRWPILIPLRRESIPVVRNSKTVSFKTSYSGAISVGRPAQEFRVVFDTGSGHVVVPSSTCKSESCLVHKGYNLSASTTATAINADGSAVPDGELCDQVTIGYGTGKVTGEFVRDQVCLGGTHEEACVEVSVVTAVEMTAQPFKSFTFDGIFGLGLDALAVAPEFSFLNRFVGANLGAALQFGVFLTGGDKEEGAPPSEIALGGHNTERLLTPLQWAPVAASQSGYWQVQIKEVRIGNHTLDLCKDGSCRGIVDTGTSHLGVPRSEFPAISRWLSVDGAGDGLDCREVEGPNVELVLEDFTLSLTPRNYMRPLSLPARLAVAPRAGGSSAAKDSQEQAAVTVSGPLSLGARRKGADGASGRTCSPRIMPVSLPAPLGPNLFILGEPVLHRYYTVYDWQERRIGFGLAAGPQNEEALRAERASAIPAAAAAPVEEVDHSDTAGDVYSFMQVTVTVSVRCRDAAGSRGGGRGLPQLDGPAL